MNEKFWKLPKEKQDRIINAGLEVFAKNPYRKAPVSEIARAAGISKSLLFHYFRNKKELYLFLYDYALSFIQDKVSEYRPPAVNDYIQLMEFSLRAKCQVAREYVYMNQFAISAYFQDDPELSDVLGPKLDQLLEDTVERTLQYIDREKFRPGLDLRLILKECVWVSEGYMNFQLRIGNTDVNRWEQDMLRLFSMWRQAYYRSEFTEEKEK
ncbi:MAG: TetR/AcrR family transcriptional regulator [Emergencia sp.]